MGDKNRRLKKNILINKGLQFKIIMMSMLYMFMVMVVTTGVILFQPLYNMFMSSDLNVQYAAAKTFLILAKQLMPAAVCVFALFFFHQLFVTHRICGPLVNFTHTFRKIAQGDFTRKVVLRKRDYLKQECDVINTMIDGLSDHFKRVQNGQIQLLDVLDKRLTKINDPDVQREIKVLAGQLRENIQALDPSQDPSA